MQTETAREGNRRSSTINEETGKTGNHFPRKSMPNHAEAYPDRSRQGLSQQSIEK